MNEISDYYIAIGYRVNIVSSLPTTASPQDTTGFTNWECVMSAHCTPRYRWNVDASAYRACNSLLHELGICGLSIVSSPDSTIHFSLHMEIKLSYKHIPQNIDIRAGATKV